MIWIKIRVLNLEKVVDVEAIPNTIPSILPSLLIISVMPNYCDYTAQFSLLNAIVNFSVQW